MTVAIESTTCAEGWIAAATHLLSVQRVDTNVVVTIKDPIFCDPSWLVRFDPQAVKASGDRIRDVINTLFPEKTWRNSASRVDFYERYERAHRRAKSRRWGTYFGRLIRFGTKGTNQLERVIYALNNWTNTPHAALTVHLSSPDTDSLAPLGAPCWHFGEFICPDSTTIDLVVVYRNHDYFNKALGNFIGLARLLNFVCLQTGRKPGRLVCHSVRAYFEVSKTNMKILVSK